MHCADTPTVSWVPLSVVLPRRKGSLVRVLFQDKDLWSFILHVVEGLQDGRRPEDIGWTRVDVGKDPPGLWKEVYIDDEAAGE